MRPLSLRPLSNQEAFDRVWNRFVVEKAPKSIEGGVCVYRGADDKRCAFGLMLPEKLYRREFEGMSAATVLGDNDPSDQMNSIGELAHLQREIRRHFEYVSHRLLLDLQSAHDNASVTENRSTIADDLRAVAKRWNLNVPE